MMIRSNQLPLKAHVSLSFSPSLAIASSLLLPGKSFALLETDALIADVLRGKQNFKNSRSWKSIAAGGVCY